MPNVSATVMFIVSMNSDGHDEDSSRLALVVVKIHMSDRKRKTNEESKATRMMKVSVTCPIKTTQSQVCGLFWVPYFTKVAALRLL